MAEVLSMGFEDSIFCKQIVRIMYCFCSGAVFSVDNVWMAPKLSVHLHLTQAACKNHPVLCCITKQFLSLSATWKLRKPPQTVSKQCTTILVMLAYPSTITFFNFIKSIAVDTNGCADVMETIRCATLNTLVIFVQLQVSTLDTLMYTGSP